jgi:hypothetical protein
MIKITEERFRKLLEAEAVLATLDSNGVTKWEWYDAAMEELPRPLLDQRVEAAVADGAYWCPYCVDEQ